MRTILRCSCRRPGPQASQRTDSSSASFTEISRSSDVSGEPSSDADAETESGSFAVDTTEASTEGANGTTDDDADELGDDDDGDGDDGDGGGVGDIGDEGILPGSQAASVSRPMLASRTSVSSAGAVESANRASARRLQSVASGGEQEANDGGDHKLVAVHQQPRKERPSAIKSKLKMSDSMIPGERQSESGFSRKKSKTRTSVQHVIASEKVVSAESNLKKHSPEKDSPKKLSPDKSNENKYSPKKPGTRKTSPNKSNLKKFSPKKSSQKEPSPRKSSPKKDNAKKSQPKKSSPKKDSPKKIQSQEIQFKEIQFKENQSKED